MRLATTKTGQTINVVDANLEEGVITAQVVYPEDLGALLKQKNWRELVEQAAGTAADTANTANTADTATITLPTSDLAALIPNPGKIICVGLNYADHIKEMGHPTPEVPTLFIKYPEALTGPFDQVTIPKQAAEALDAESELAVIIGSKAHRVSEAEAAKHIAGYAVINDYTLRDWQKRTQQWHQGKSYYRTAGFGPWLTTREEYTPGTRITAHWDGELMQDSTTDQLVFSPEFLVSFISQIYPLQPGDVIATGTPDGVGFARNPARFIQHGQAVRCAIEGLGWIENTTLIEG
ncbi:fumarylacetoacetate hydrolase family protein [Corynebacterium sp. 35RC1]|nr:fumarylacetoacetate hydrolase family protein [Corynebacterium sp. 35RC1]